MEFFKEINIANWKTVQEYCLSKWDGNITQPIIFKDESLVYLGSLIEPSIKEELNLTVKVKTAIMFINEPHSEQNLHVDGFELERKGASNCALNLPILNCDKGPMFWYSGDYYLTKSTSNSLKYLIINWNTDPQLVCTKIIDKPTLVKIDVPHHVANQSDKPRLMLSVRFSPDMQLG
jgi:hypothetical protein